MAAAFAEFLDLRFHLDPAARIEEAIVARDAAAPFAYVVTPNVDHLVRLQLRRSDLWPVYRAAWITLCDSRILARLARLARVALPVVTGSDLTREIFTSGIGREDRVAVLGGEAAMVETLRQRYGLTDVVHHNPPMGFIHDRGEVTRAVEFLVSARARYSFIAVGSPQQEIIAYRASRAGATGIGLCVGASLEFLAGRQWRAPRAMQHLGMEWLFRLLSNPRRLWRRYLVEGPEILLVCAKWQRRLTRTAGGE